MRNNSSTIAGASPHLLLPAGQNPRSRREPLLQHRKYGAYLFQGLGAAGAGRGAVAAELEVLAHREAGEKAPTLGDERHAVVAVAVCGHTK
jgi:hypothetical protein